MSISHRSLAYFLSLLLVVPLSAAAQDRAPERTQDRPRDRAQERSQDRATPDAQRIQRDQQRGQQLQRGQRGQRDAGSDRQLTEFLAGKLMLANQSAIELSQFAAQKAQHAEVKQFAQMLIRDHNALNEKLAKFAPDAARDLSDTSRSSSALGPRDPSTQERGRDFQDRTATRDLNNQPPSAGQDRPDATRERQVPGQPREGLAREGQPQEEAERRAFRGDQTREPQATVTERPGRQSPERMARDSGSNALLEQLCSIHKEAAQNHLQSAKQLLSEYQGQDFDMGFLGMQIAGHTWMIAELKAMEDVGSGEFQGVIQEASATTKGHLEKAKQLSEQFEKDRPQSTTPAHTSPANRNRGNE